MTTCELCGKMLPLGGVIDAVGRPVHYYCRELRKLQTAPPAATPRRGSSRHSPPLSDASPLLHATLTPTR